MSKVNLTPQGWREVKLGDVGEVAMCRRIFKEQTSESGDIPFYKIGTFGSVPDAYISRILFEDYKAKYPYPEVGDILISAAGSIGRIVEYVGKEEYFQDSNIVWLKHGEQICNHFLKYFYIIVNWHGIEGSTIKRLYNKNILETKLLLPPLPEQQAIAGVLNEWDEVLGLYEKKLGLARDLKKGMMQRLFKRGDLQDGKPTAVAPTNPSNASDQESVEWREVRLGDLEDMQIIKLGRGNVISREDIKNSPGNYPVYSCSSVGNGEIGQYGEYMFDDIRISWSIDGGGRFFYRSAHRYSITNVSGWLKVLDNNVADTKYLFYALSKKWETEKFDYTNKVHPSVLRNVYSVLLPPLPVQRHIAAQLTTVDEEIELIGKKIASLKEQRKWLLNNLVTGKVRLPEFRVNDDKNGDENA